MRMAEPGPPLAVSDGYAVVNTELSMRTLAFVFGGTVKPCSGKPAGDGMPAARTTLPPGANFISMAGRVSATSCQALGASDSPRREPRLSETGFVHDLLEEALSHCQS